MSFHLVVRPEVDADLVEAEAWYEGPRPGLRREFVQAVRTAMARLALNEVTLRLTMKRLFLSLSRRLRLAFDT